MYGIETSLAAKAMMQGLEKKNTLDAAQGGNAIVQGQPDTDSILNQTREEASKNWNGSWLGNAMDEARWRQEQETVRQTAMGDASTEAERTKYKWMGKENLSTDQMATQAAEREEARYQDMYRPHNQKVMGSIGNNSIVNSAKKSLNQAQDSGEARRKRNLNRYGVTESAAESQNNNRLDKLQNALTRSSVMGDANLKQYERDDMLRNEMINLGRNIATSGQSGLDVAAANETARNNQQTQMDAQASAQRMQMAGSLAAMAIFFA